MERVKIVRKIKTKMEDYFVVGFEGPKRYSWIG